MKKKLKNLIYTRAFSTFAYYLIRLYSATFRLRVINEDAWINLHQSGETVLLCAWHQQFFAAIRYFKGYAKYHPALMISQSRDGNLIAGVARKTGWHTARGSSSRGGKQALEAMIDHLQTHRLGAHLLDGPTGPMGTVKAGAVKMARETGAFVVPFYTHAANAWFFHSWDRFMLPRPFARVTLSYGEPVFFEKSDLPEQFETQRQFLETTMLPKLMHRRS